jgi:hypothetical protein
MPAVPATAVALAVDSSVALMKTSSTVFPLVLPMSTPGSK